MHVNFIHSYCIYKNIHYIHSFVYVVELTILEKTKSIIQLTNMTKIVKLSLHWASNGHLCQREKEVGRYYMHCQRFRLFFWDTSACVSILHQAHDSYLIQLLKERWKERKGKRKEERYGVEREERKKVEQGVRREGGWPPWICE